jgi:hypothetical protein
MKRLFGTIIAIAAGLMVFVGAVGLLRDSSLFASSPEEVAEGFVRHLVSGDFAGAKSYLATTMRSELDEEDLQHFAIFIMMRSGEVVDVKGERGWVKGSRAEASAKLVTSVAGELALSLRMVRDRGSWSIAEIGTIEQETGESIFGTKIPTAIAMNHTSVSIAVAAG